MEDFDRYDALRFAIQEASDTRHLWGIGMVFPVTMPGDDRLRLHRDRRAYGMWAYRQKEDGSCERVDPYNLFVPAPVADEGESVGNHGAETPNG